MKSVYYHDLYMMFVGLIVNTTVGANTIMLVFSLPRVDYFSKLGTFQETRFLLIFLDFMHWNVQLSFALIFLLASVITSTRRLPFASSSTAVCTSCIIPLRLFFFFFSLRLIIDCTISHSSFLFPLITQNALLVKQAMISGLFCKTSYCYASMLRGASFYCLPQLIYKA